METNDPYADDFYFLQLNIKKNNAARERAVLEQRPLPSAIYVPLPVWKETKERIKLQIESTRQSFHQKSREWEEKEMVSRVTSCRSSRRMHAMKDALCDNWGNACPLHGCTVGARSPGPVGHPSPEGAVVRSIAARL